MGLNIFVFAKSFDLQKTSIVTRNFDVMRTCLRIRENLWEFVHSLWLCWNDRLSKEGPKSERSILDIIINVYVQRLEHKSIFVKRRNLKSTKSE